MICFDLSLLDGLRRRHLHFLWRCHLVRQSSAWTVMFVSSVGIWDLMDPFLFVVCAAQRSALPLRARARAVPAHEETIVKNYRFLPLGSAQRSYEDGSGSGVGVVRRHCYFIDCECFGNCMARTRKVKNVERTFVYDLTQLVPPQESTLKSNGLYIDLMQSHSLVNRLFARQGMNVLVENLEIGVQPGGAFEATVFRLPQHWACVNAWTKTMALWKKQQDDTAEEAGLESTIARYRDFKIYFDAGHKDAGFGANLLPAGFVTTDAAGTNESYEWFDSEIVIPNDAVVGNTTERELFMLGDDDGNGIGMIKAYAESRQRPQQTDPNIVDVATAGIFGQMFDVGDDDNVVITNMQDANDVPPYLMGMDGTEEYYPGGSFQGIGPSNASGLVLAGQMVDIISVNASHNYNTDSTGSFAAPCGLIKIVINANGVAIQNPADLGDAPFSIWIKVKLAPGHYQGIAAIPMQEAN